MIPKDCKRLAEVDFPIAEVSRHAAREKSIRHGHPEHAAPLVGTAAAGVEPGDAARAALARPVRSALPGGVQGEARELLPHVRRARSGTTDEDLRNALLKFIADFANWDNAANVSIST